MNKEDALMDLKRVFISPTISSAKMVKVKEVYNEVLESDTISPTLKTKIDRIKSGKF